MTQHFPLLFLLGIAWKELKAGTQAGTCMPVFTAACAQEPVDENNPGVHQQMKGQTGCGLSIQWNIIWPLEGMKFDSCYSMDVP